MVLSSAIENILKHILRLAYLIYNLGGWKLKKVIFIRTLRPVFTRNKLSELLYSYPYYILPTSECSSKFVISTSLNWYDGLVSDSWQFLSCDTASPKKVAILLLLQRLSLNPLVMTEMTGKLSKREVWMLVLSFMYVCRALLT